MTDDKDKKHRFNWHKEAERIRGYDGSFLSWLIVEMMPAPGSKEHEKKFMELSEATDSFKACELGITLNGVEVDAKNFVDVLESAVERAVDREAAKIVAGISRIQTLKETVEELDRTITTEIFKRAAEAGLEISYDDLR